MSEVKKTSHWLYPRWNAVRQRCLNPAYKSYARYGGRGIGLDPEWTADFWCFVRDIEALPKPSPHYNSIDRIDNSRGYYKDNVRWATPTMQTRNREKELSWSEPLPPGVTIAPNWQGVVCRTTVDGRPYRYFGTLERACQFQGAMDRYRNMLIAADEWS